MYEVVEVVYWLPLTLTMYVCSVGLQPQFVTGFHERVGAWFMAMPFAGDERTGESRGSQGHGILSKLFGQRLFPQGVHSVVPHFMPKVVAMFPHVSVVV